MSFSNTNTGSKPADPVTAANLDNDVPLKVRVEDLESFIKSTNFGMLTTRAGDSGQLVSRCMGVAATECGGIDLLFFTNTESGKTDQLAKDPHVNASFLNTTSGSWASISGEAEIITDRNLIHQHYNQGLKAWMGDLGDGKHDGGKDDPRIGIIRVRTVSATYAITDKTMVSRGAEIAVGMVTGRAPRVNKLREISPAEVTQWRTVSQAK